MSVNENGIDASKLDVKRVLSIARRLSIAAIGLGRTQHKVCRPRLEFKARPIDPYWKRVPGWRYHLQGRDGSYAMCVMPDKCASQESVQKLMVEAAEEEDRLRASGEKIFYDIPTNRVHTQAQPTE
jgi:hypothetical protein